MYKILNDITRTAASVPVVIVTGNFSDSSGR